ncbi:MAG: hypothetical protein IJT94_08875 [Oscillibacter sp.]|nr:hypothetical protein [Oscillibacter sp.]
MGLLDKLRSSAGRFMVGRNGVDALNQALLTGYIALWILRMIPVLFRAGLVVRGIDVLMNVAAVLLIFRMLSRNLPARQAENLKWLSWRNRFLVKCRRLGITDSVRDVKNSIQGAAARHADKEHKYFTCKNCKAICRVPAGKGKIVLTCPKCGAQIKGKT